MIILAPRQQLSEPPAAKGPVWSKRTPILIVGPCASAGRSGAATMTTAPTRNSASTIRTMVIGLDLLGRKVAVTLTQDFRYGSIFASVTTSAEPAVPSASSSTRPTTATTVSLPNPGRQCGPLLPNLATPTMSCKDTGAAPPPAAQFPCSLTRTLAQVGCHASR